MLTIFFFFVQEVGGGGCCSSVEVKVLVMALVLDVGSGVEGSSDDDGMVVSVGGMIVEVPVLVAVPEPSPADVVSVAVMPDDSPLGGVVASGTETEEGGGSASERICKGVVATSVITPGASAVVVSPVVGTVVLGGTAYSRCS